MEKINHPNHYNPAGRKECIVEMEEEYGVEAVIDFCILSAYKYEYRAGTKEGEDAKDDLRKALWYYRYAYKKMCECEEEE